MDYGVQSWRNKKYNDGQQPNPWFQRQERGGMPSRSGSRGRGRWQSQQRGPARPPYQPQINHDTKTSTEMEDIRQLLANFGKGLEAITKRLDGIQGEPAQVKESAPANRHPFNKPSSRSGPTPKLHEESSNQSFSAVIRSVYRMVQLQHHEANWDSLPKAISGRLDKFASDIRPPMPDDDFSSAIKAATVEYGDKICAVVKRHIQKKRVDIEVSASKLNPADKEKAKTIAGEQLTARLGRRLTQTKRDSLLSDACGMVGIHYNSAEQVIDEAFQLVVNGPSASTKKRKQPTTTSNRFEALSIETDDVIELAEDDNQAPSVAVLHSPKKAKFVLSKPPSATTVGKLTPSPSSSRQSRGVVEGVKGVFNHDAPKDDWSLTIDASTKVVVIADSNMRRSPEAPMEWEIHSFSGAKFRHATQLLDNMTVKNGESTLQHIIIQIGVNHRTDRPEWFEKELAELRSTLKGITVNSTFTGISVADSLPRKQRETVIKINESLQQDESFGYIAPIPSSDIVIVPGDFYGTHHTSETIARVISTMVTYNSDLN